MSEACFAGELERIATHLAARHAHCDDEIARTQRIAHDLAAETGLTPEDAAQWVKLALGPAS
jgi:hypothetical protein